MSATQMSREQAPQIPAAAAVDTKLEVVVLPVADVERSKRFYEKLGWRVDADFSNGDSWRAVQLTPPGSPCSVIFGKNFTTAVPGSLQGTFLVVNDVAAARADLVSRGVAVSDVFHFEGVLRVDTADGRAAGPDPEGRSYRSWVSFNDPDGNSWMVQEVKTRLPGRGTSNFDVATLTELLRDAEKQHGEYEATAAKHHWSDWYAAYVVARQQGRTADEAAAEGARNVEKTRA
jgi:catechol 2,3-dioxygenase-like lactoylglutathione lyase family enzyme